VQPDGKVLVQLFDTNRYRHFLVRLDAQGVSEGGLPMTLDGGVSTIAMQRDGKVIIGGAFRAINDIPTASLARLNADGTVDSGFRCSIQMQPVAMAVDDDGRLYIGYGPGVDSTAGLIRMQNDGSIDPSFRVDTGRYAPAAVVDLGGGRLLIGGSFQDIHGMPRAGVARLITATSVPCIANWFRIGSMVRFSVPTLNGESYALERAASLDRSQWTIVDSMLGDGANRVLVDNHALSGSAFYRISLR
jgi:hypothetical protein